MASSYKTGVQDTAAGAGVKEFVGLALQSDDAALVQAVDNIPGGQNFYMCAYSGSITPVIESQTVPYWDVAAYRVPNNTIMLVDALYIWQSAADETMLRIASRYLMGGNCAQAAPAAGGAPTVAAAAQFGTGLSAAAYSYKLSQFNALNQEGPLSTVSANVTPAANQGINITIPALGTGSVGYRIYRSLGGAAGGPWYWVDDSAGGVTYLDVNADSYLTDIRGSTPHPGTTWGNAYASPQLASPVEMVYENVGVALASAPANIAYVSGKGVPSVTAFAPAVTVNTRVRIPPANEGRGFAASGPASFQCQNPQIADYGATKFLGFDKSYATIGGQWVVWGHDIRGQTTLDTAAGAGRFIGRLFRPAVFYPGETLVGQIGNTSTAAAGVRKIEITGRMFTLPT